MRNKKGWFMAVFILSLLAFFSGAYYLQKRLLPQQIRTIQTNLNVPIRYAFITDSNRAQLAILDTYNDSLLDTVMLEVPADFVTVSRLGGFLAYANQGDTAIYLLDLEKKTTHRMTVKDKIEGLSAHFNGRWLVYQTHNAVVMLDSQGKEHYRLETSGSVSITYHLDGERIFISDLVRGVVWQYIWQTQQLDQLFSLDQRISPLSIMPDGSALVFAVKQHHSASLQRYSLVDQSLFDTGIHVALLRPYITADNQSILAITSRKNQSMLLQIDSHRMTVKRDYKLGVLAKSESADTDWIRTGWLEQIAVVAGENALYLIELDSDLPVDKIPLTGNVRQLLVQSDTKKLFATVTGSQDVWAVDLRRRALSPNIPLPLKQPDVLVMGQTNTLCH